MSDYTFRRVPMTPQAIDAPLSQFALFLVVTVAPTPDAADTVRDVLGGLDDLVKTVGFRDLDAALSCVVGVGAEVWPRLIPAVRPPELHPFREIRGAVHTAPSTAGDLLFHIRSGRRDLVFEFEKLLLAALGDAVSVVDETEGFRYFDVRDVLGFVDGTANPVSTDLASSTLVSDENSVGFGGSYVVVQKYTHPVALWEKLTTEEQERIIGRRKIDNVELDDATEGQKAHKTLATIVDEDGVEHDILRDNMPFGSPATEMGTYFIGYASELWVIEEMLERMFIGDPPGRYDRLLDYSVPKTGTTFFAPSASVLSSLSDA